MKVNTYREYRHMLKNGRKDITYEEFCNRLDALGYKIDETFTFCGSERGTENYFLSSTVYIIEKNTLLSFKDSRARNDVRRDLLLQLLGSTVCLYKGRLVFSQ